MQQINLAYQQILQFIEDYRFELVETSSPEDLHEVVAQPLCHRGLESAAPPRFRGRPGLMQVICFLIMIFLAGLGHPGTGLAAPPGRPSGRS